MSRITDLVRGSERVPGNPVPLTTPIFETTTYLFDNAAEVIAYNEGKTDKYRYSRYGNPTVVAVEDVLATLDAAEGALLFSSGMAAISSVFLARMRAGDHVVALRTSSQSNGITRLSKPPQDAPMPNSVSASMKALTAASGTGLSTMLNRPHAPVKSRFQIA